jgi:7-keto-8-aminopelargonate synthetase-like enzyme
MRYCFRELGFNTGASETPVIPVVVGEKKQAALMWKALFDAGVFVNIVVPPAVPPKASCLRTSYMATHTDEQLDQIVAAFKTVASTRG